MRFTSLMMYISPVWLIISYASIGLSAVARRASRYDASPVPRKPRSAPETRTSDAVTPRGSPGNGFAARPLKTLISASAIVYTGASTSTAAAFQLPTADSTTTTAAAATGEQNAAFVSRLSGVGKRSTYDARTSVYPPEKLQQTMVSMVSQRTANDAWSADNIGTSLSSIENNQELLCNCSGEGILDPDDCDLHTGQCACLSGYTGLQCEDCEEGHFTNGTSGCLPCGCDSFGAVNHLCDSSGTCACKTGVYGPKCDECHPGFFRFSSTGCQPCQCHNHTNYCHPQSGVCLNCLDNTQGANCEECKPNFYHSPSADLMDPCAPCPCSNATSTGSCHTDPGGFPVCDQCLPLYTGNKCETCAAGFYKASGICVPCECNGNAEPKGPVQICHPETGNCLSCANNTTGPQCQLCAPGFSGNALIHNCTRPAVQVITATETEYSTSTALFSPTTAHAGESRATSTSPSHTSGNTTQTMSTGPSSPTDNTTDTSPSEVSWTQFNVVILAVILLVALLLLGFVGGVYTYREYQNRKLNAPFWTIELKEDNISFSSYHDSIPNADVSGLLEDEATEVAPNGQLALTTMQGNCYKA